MNKSYDKLPLYIQPLRLAEQGARLQGSLELKQLPRLQELLRDDQGLVSVDLQFGRDAEQLRYIQGTLAACLHLVCQRCLQAMDYPLQAQVSLSPVMTEAAGNKLPERYEPLMLTEDKLLLTELVEDELLLNLPLVAKHETTCTVP